MEITANQVSVEQLIALIEARQFPIGVDFAAPLAQRLYDAMAVLMCQGSIATRQASIARRYINTAMSEMGNNQGGYYYMKKCLEEMNAQGQGETPAVVLCQQYSAEVADVVARLGDVEALSCELGVIAKRHLDVAGELDAGVALRTAASALRDLMQFVPTGVVHGR